MCHARRPIAIFLCVAAALLLASPFGLHCLGLSGVDGLPKKPLQLASEEQQALVWKLARAHGEPGIEAMNPYSFAIALVVKTDARMPPDQIIVWQVASNVSVQRSHL